MSRIFLARKGFTLSEILIALSIMGVISLMTVPKVLFSQQLASYNPKVKDAIFMVQAAYSEYQNENLAASTTTWAQLTPYMNYIRVNTTSNMDSYGSVSGCGGSVPNVSCSDAGFQCLVLPNGSLLRYQPGTSFNGTGNLNALDFMVDPDGKYTNNGSVWAFLYYSGNVKSVGHIDANTTNSAGTVASANTVWDPDWFDWK